MEGARALMAGDYEGVEELTKVEQARNVRLGEETLKAIHVRYSNRMHSLSKFFRGMLQHFNWEHGRKGVLWESRFRSVIVEDGAAARTMAAYLDLNSVRAGIC